MLHNTTILLTVNGLSSHFCWKMSDVNHTQQGGFHKAGVTGLDRHFFDAFLSTHTHSNWVNFYH